MVFVSEIVKVGFLVTPFACYLCDVTTERKKVPRRRNDKRFILKRREMTTYISIFPDSVCIQNEVHFEMQINKQIITKLNVILRVSFKILKWIFPLLFLWQWSEFNVTTSSLTKRFPPFIPK